MAGSSHNIIDATRNTLILTKLTTDLELTVRVFDTYAEGEEVHGLVVALLGVEYADLVKDCKKL
jgi:hypothetical protein